MNSDTLLSGETDILSVSQLNQQARRLLEINFHNIRVEGEISGLAIPTSGHWYFTLKDSNAQIRCAIFKNKNRLLQLQPSDGLQIQARGRVSLYENRGDYQLIVEHMAIAGSGALQKAFNILKEKLANEGLFKTDNKQLLPKFPKHIAIITSPTGAAIRDIISVFKRRAPFIKLSIIPSAVQGEKAEDQLINALSLVKRISADACIIGRGGGSIEDLWPFNGEKLARAIFSHPTPIISAVGHETDFSIADFVADYRAPTPSAAAEVLSPDSDHLLEKVQRLNHKLSLLTVQNIQILSEKLSHINKRLRTPKAQLREYIQRLDDLEIRMIQANNFMFKVLKERIQRLNHSFQQQSPQYYIQQHTLTLKHQSQLLHHLMGQQLIIKKNKIQSISRQLHGVSPLSTLARGYSIIQKDHKVVSSTTDLQENDPITVLLHKGSAHCTVNTIHKQPLSTFLTCHQPADSE